MTNQEAAIKMAEVAKVEVRESIYSSSLMINNSIEEWNPQENIAQMMEVMNCGEFPFWEVTCRSSLSKRWFNCHVKNCMFESSMSMQVAMFQAVKKWMEA